ncbi:MAG TPA: hypothetical protein ENJ09_14810 [Planctomycetes bacterium]|nr:hypothetical protein [Planctomycetota bacterium]
MDPGRARVQVAPAADASRVLPLDPLERARAAWELHPAPGGSGGDVFVLGPDGELLAGATVVLVDDVTGASDFTILERAVSDETGRVECEALARADVLVLWAPGLPATVVEDELLEGYRELADGEALVIPLDATDLVTGRITIDGRAPADGEVTPHFLFPSPPRDWPSLHGKLERALRKLDPPGRVPRVVLGEEGSFRVDAFRWPGGDGKRAPRAQFYCEEKDLFLESRLAGEWTERFRLRSEWIARPEGPLVLSLVHGSWIEGRVLFIGDDLPTRPMFLRFALPDSDQRRERVEVDPGGSFRFAVPYPCPDLDLELQTGLGGRDGAKRFHFGAPGVARGASFDLGTLEVQLEDSLLLSVRSEDGTPIRGASAFVVDPLLSFGPPSRPVDEGELSVGDRWGRARLSDASGRLLVERPGRGEQLVVGHPAFETSMIPMSGLGSDAAERGHTLDVVLHSAATLVLRARVPEGFPLERLLVQVEADREALFLHAGDRSSVGEEAGTRASSRVAERTLDAGSDRAWSYTTDFSRARSVVGSRRSTLALRPVRAGVAMDVRVFDLASGVFFERRLAPFVRGETRELDVDLPRSVFLRRGTVVDDGGAPAAGLELSFGAPVPVFLGRTEYDGTFSFPVLGDRSGILLLETSRTWNAALDIGGVSGRISNAVHLEREFRFEPAGVTEIRLPAPRRLRITLREDSGMESPAAWEVRLFEAETGTYLGGDVPVWMRRPGEERVLRAPPRTPLRLVAAIEGARVEARVGEEATEVEVRVPTLGTLEARFPESNGNAHGAWARFEPLDGKEPFLRVAPEASERAVFPELAPGHYRVFFRRSSPEEGGRWSGPRSVEAVVLPGGTTRVEVP